MNIKPVPLYFLIALLVTSCSETSLKDEAVNIFDANLSGENEEIEIGNNVIRSLDGLQFTKAEEDGNQSETVGLTSEGKVSFEGEMKNGKPHGEWTTFFPDGRPRWKGNKNEGVSHGPFTMWYQDGRKKWKETTRMVKSMDYPPCGTLMVRNGENKDTSKAKLPDIGVLGIKKEN